MKILFERHASNSVSVKVPIYVDRILSLHIKATLKSSHGNSGEMHNDDRVLACMTSQHGRNSLK